jgi:hypothetical protein
MGTLKINNKKIKSKSRTREKSSGKAGSSVILNADQQSQIVTLKKVSFMKDEGSQERPWR